MQKTFITFVGLPLCLSLHRLKVDRPLLLLQREDLAQLEWKRRVAPRNVRKYFMLHVKSADTRPYHRDTSCEDIVNHFR
jgi:hypothetical protein